MPCSLKMIVLKVMSLSPHMCTCMCTRSLVDTFAPVAHVTSLPFAQSVLSGLVMSDFCDPVDCSPPGSSVCGILQARTLEWVTISPSRGSSQPKDRTQVSCVSFIGRQILYHYPTFTTTPILHEQQNKEVKLNSSLCYLAAAWSR